MIRASMLDDLRRLHSHSNAKCLVERCSNQGVTLRLPRSGCVCVDCDECGEFGDNETKPDYIGLMDRGAGQRYWFILEMKSSVRDDTAIRQLQAGADKIRNSRAFAVSGAPDEIRPIIVHGRGKTRISSGARRLIRFGNKKFAVLTKRSGGQLHP